MIKNETTRNNKYVCAKYKPEERQIANIINRILFATEHVNYGTSIQIEDRIITKVYVL